MKKSFATITMFKKMEYSERFKELELIGSRDIGAYPDFKMACEAVKENVCDICETIYDYALVQHMEFGVYPMLLEQKLFKVKNITKIGSDLKDYYNFDLTYEEIEIPENFCNVGYAIG